ncbi:putative Na+/H+ antiporter [Caballeronia sp. S22]|uniref:putative Na+/H+ antiporter n=1 Tax=Caballeronia sp. S22 TaxID=3137182 RepID=UPI00353128EE
MPHSVEVAAAVIFALALIHTFAVARIDTLGHRFPRHSGVFHFLAEVEVVFGFWALALCLVMWMLVGSEATIDYLENREFTEALFVFVVMVIAASRPILVLMTNAVMALSRFLPVRTEVAVVWFAPCAIPLLGSFVTEPAAMTLAALLLRDRLFVAQVPERVRYFGLALLFVNVSIGGVMTAYAAPPVLMVASAWGWNTGFMAATFGWKAALAVAFNATLFVALAAKSVPTLASNDRADTSPLERVPVGVTLVHLAFLALVVINSHHAVVFIGAFLFFLGYTHAYERHQSALMLRESLLVAFFLGGLAVLVQHPSNSLIIIGLQIRLQERDDDLGHLVERTCARQRLPSSGVAAKGGTITIAGELGKARHNSRFVIIEAFDQQVPPVGLCDDLLMAEQAAQLTLKFSRVMFGGYGWHVCLSITMCPFATDSPGKSI